MRAEAMLVAGLVLAGCAGSAGERANGADEAMTGDVAATVEVKLQGDSVRMHLHVTNRGSTPLAFTFPTSQRYDFAVRDASGETIWRWSDGMAFMQAISRATLAPGETWEFEAAWAPGNRAGVHEVVGRITAQEHGVQQSASFELP